MIKRTLRPLAPGAARPSRSATLRPMAAAVIGPDEAPIALTRLRPVQRGDLEGIESLLASDEVMPLERAVRSVCETIRTRPPGVRAIEVRAVGVTAAEDRG